MNGVVAADGAVLVLLACVRVLVQLRVLVRLACVLVLRLQRGGPEVEHGGENEMLRSVET